jgi:hypothetical protein
MNETYDLIIVGCGYAGAITAINIKKGIKTLILEKNKTILKKFINTGGPNGSNITNNMDIKEIIKSHIFQDSKFLYSTLSNYGPKEILDFLHSNNIQYEYKYKTRVFLTEGNSNFREIIINKIKEIAEIKFEEVVKNIQHKNDLFYISTNNQKYVAKNVLISTGGLSHRNTGATGDGYYLLKDLDHELLNTYPIGSSFILKNNQFKNLSGTSLKNSVMTVKLNNKLIKSETHDLMITHVGLGGPLIRRVSHYFDINNNYDFIFSLMSNEEFETNFLNKKDKLNNIFPNLTKKLKNYILDELNLDPEKQIANLQKSEYLKLKDFVLNNKLDILETRGFLDSISTGGGTNIKNFDTKTFESKKIPGLFAIGEVLSTGVLTGGFNLTICFSEAKTVSNVINKKFIKT